MIFQRCLLLVALVTLGVRADESVLEYLKCQICEVPHLSGKIDDCCCDVESVDDVNSRHVLPILHDLTKKTFFRYFKVDLWKECPFWRDDGQCHMRDCAVCECEPSEIPLCWSTSDANASDATVELPTPAPTVPEVDNPILVEELSRVTFGAGDNNDSFVGWKLGNGLPGQDARVQAGSAGDPAHAAANGSPAPGAGAKEARAVWTEEEEGPDVKYVNLLRNPEGYTGYAGPSAVGVWRAIYSENCFTGPLDDMCYEERVFYRMISGLQTSINTHIAMTLGDGLGIGDADMYTTSAATAGAGGAEGAAASLPDEASVPWWYAPAVWLHKAAGVVTGQPEEHAASVTRLHAKRHPHELVLTSGLQPSIDMYVDRIAKYPERLNNLYFTYLFVLRAVIKAQPVLKTLDFNTGNITEDADTKAMLLHLIEIEAPNVAKGFDESQMFVEPTVDVASTAATCATGPSAPEGVNASDITDLLVRTREANGHHAAEHETEGATGVVGGSTPKALLRQSWMDKYKNISRILDCIGCEKCRLWGKVQFLGLGTAIKILFADSGVGAAKLSDLHFSRNELVALINVFHRLSMSLSAVTVMRDLDMQRKLHALLLKACICAAVLAVTTLFLCCTRRKATPSGEASASGAPTSEKKKRQ